MKNYIVILTVLCLFLVACIYFRTGYFESSISTNETTFHFKDGDSITTHKYYRDLSGNWILLDKKVIVSKDGWISTSVSTN